VRHTTNYRINMSIIKSEKPDGQNCISIQPDCETQNTVQKLKNDGYVKIHNPETGESYN